MIDQTSITVVAGFLGLVLGSFLNVCVLRWPYDESVVSPPSRCPGCGTGIRWYDNIPVVGWVALAGKCRNCRIGISSQYALVELVSGLVWAAMFWQHGLSVDALSGSLFLTILLGISLTDARFYVIPDQFSVGGAALGLALAFAPGGITPAFAGFGAAVGFGGMWLVGVGGTWLISRMNPGRLEEAAVEHVEGRDRASQAPAVRFLNRPRGQVAALLPGVLVLAWCTARGYPASTVLGAVAGCWALATILLAWTEGLAAEADLTGSAEESEDDPTEGLGSVLGGGDIKMMALIGAFTGPWGVALTVFFGALSGTLVFVILNLLFKQLIPFGIFLAIGAVITLLWADPIMAWYLTFLLGG